MPRIQVLPEALRNKIAAGEVVERPASVVKELIENSLDAGSTRIVIDIARAGKKVIRVADNGAGMDREDTLLACERYATSKIRSVDDLFNLKTMGFRGEALSSIAAVSRVKLITVLRPQNLDTLAREEPSEDSDFFRQQDSWKEGSPGLTGTSLEIAGGERGEVKECPALGTTIEVRDLFFNTPARRKFLKSESTENHHIVDVVTREALSHYDTGFILRMDGEETLSLPAARSHRERLMQVFGKDFVDGLVESTQSTNQGSVAVFLGKAAQARNSRLNQYLFVNQRPVRDQALTHAVYRAYEDLIPRDKHPVFLLFLTIAPQKVDFNVHPTKREVRFEDGSALFSLVYQTAKAALTHRTDDTASFTEDEQVGRWDGEKWADGKNISPAHLPAFTPSDTMPDSGSMISERIDFSYSGGIPSLYLGDTFVAFPGKGGLTLIDYHAAHERVNFERFLKKISMDSYRLLFPQQVKLSVSEYRAVIENRELLHELGIEVDDFGHNTIIVRSLPEMLRDSDVTALMGDVAASLLQRDEGLDESTSGEGLQPFNSRKRHVAASLACHSSIRGREVPDGARLAELLRSLDSTENPDRCPHGRPTRVFISLDELKKMFKK